MMIGAAITIERMASAMTRGRGGDRMKMNDFSISSIT